MTTNTIAIWAETVSPTGELIMGANTPSGLPWPRNRRDLAHFAELTAGRALIMGRKTFDLLPSSMKSRENTRQRPLIVLTNDEHAWQLNGSTPGLSIQALSWVTGSHAAKDLLEALRDAPNIWDEFAGRGVAVIGGPRVIELFAPYCDKLEVTLINGPHKGNVPSPSNAIFDHFTWLGSVQTDGLAFHTHIKRSTK